MLNGAIKTKLAMDTGASRTCMTRGMLLEFKKQVPILTQLVERVPFELGDTRIIHADEVAFCDLYIAAKFAPIALRKVPVYILHGESGNEILLGVPEQEALGIASPKTCSISYHRKVQKI